MNSFYNSKSFILNSDGFTNTMISESQARIFNFHIAKHATHTNGFFFPKNFEKIFNYLEFNNINTAYFSLHPLYELKNKHKKYLIKTKKKIFWVNLEEKIKLANFSKSVKEKIKKYKKFDFSETSIEDFIKVYEQQNYFNSNLKLNLKFKNIKIFKIKNNFGASYAVLGISKNTIEYLLACSSKKSKDLQSVLIFQLLNYFYNKASIFNLGGGIIPGDGIEKFKSFFNSQFKQQEVIQIVLNKIKFNQVLERQKKVNFFPPYASKSIVKKYF